MVPHDSLRIQLFRLFHKTSLFIDPGYYQIEPLVDSGVIEAHLITGRFSFLKNDLDNWLNKMGAEDIFKTCTYNAKDQQPHLYKYETINQLNLDIYIEDNWDVVKYLNYKCELDKNKMQTYWIYNFLDKDIDYQHKFPSLKPAIRNIITTYQLG